MSARPLTKIKAGKAAEICRLVTLDEKAVQQLDDEVTPAAFLDRLLAENAFVDAIRFLAQALPKREATWWACLAARPALPPNPKPPLVAALEAAEAWVYKPTEENRRAALAAGQNAGSDHPGGWAALAAGWSGGSFAPPDGPVIPPGENLTPTAVAAAVIEAALEGQRGDLNQRFRGLLAQGMDIAAGGTGRLKAQSA
jgi:hypothetical protein